LRGRGGGHAPVTRDSRCRAACIWCGWRREGSRRHSVCWSFDETVYAAGANGNVAPTATISGV